MTCACRANEAVAVCRHLMGGPSPSSRYWGASLLNQLCAEPVVLDEIIEQGLAAELVLAMQPCLEPLLGSTAGASQGLTSGGDGVAVQGAAVGSSGAGVQGAAGAEAGVGLQGGASAHASSEASRVDVQHGSKLGTEGSEGDVAAAGPAGDEAAADSGGMPAVDIDAAAWAATRMLDGALARVQAAWVAAKVAAVEGGAGVESLVRAGAVGGLVALLIEAADAVTAAGVASRNGGGGGSSGSGVSGADLRVTGKAPDVGCEW